MAQPQDVNDFLMSSGVTSFKFDTVGKTAKGTVLSLDLQQQRDLKTKDPKFWDQEKTQPMMQLRIVLQTDDRDPEKPDDDGHRALYAKGNMQNAIREAIKAAGRDKIEEGGTLAVKYEKDGKSETAGFNPPKEYIAQYKPPETSPTSVSTDDLL